MTHKIKLTIDGMNNEEHIHRIFVNGTYTSQLLFNLELYEYHLLRNQTNIGICYTYFPRK